MILPLFRCGLATNIGVRALRRGALKLPETSAPLKLNLFAREKPVKYYLQLVAMT
jgi:hypothetical protein